MAGSGIVCSVSRSGNVWDNAAMEESFFPSLESERTARKTCRSRNEARADVFDYIERFYNAVRHRSASAASRSGTPPSSPAPCR
jgi:putative transposase